MEKLNNIKNHLIELKENSSFVKKISTVSKINILNKIAQLLEKNKNKIIELNKLDTQEYKQSRNFKNELLDRLVLSEKRINNMIESLKQVAAYPDPVGKLIFQKKLKNGLILNKIKEPFGVIFFIFESRPNVITEAFSIALMSGNIMILKGGKESHRTSEIIYQIMEQALKESQIDLKIFWGLSQVDREVTDYILTQNQYVDLVIPRGGEGLIKAIKEKSKIPVLKNDRGLCHIYVHNQANIKMACDIVCNAKLSRPSVCNSAETLIIDESIVSNFLNEFKINVVSEIQKLQTIDSLIKLEIKVPLDYLPLFKNSFSNNAEQILISEINELDFDTEHLSYILNIKVCENFQQAIRFINQHSSKHSESIITENQEVAAQFQNQIDSACVYWNASTRFTDGMEFGLGGEIGISTDKLHVRGPVGIDSLTNEKWIINGQGQIRI